MAALETLQKVSVVGFERKDKKGVEYPFIGCPFEVSASIKLGSPILIALKIIFAH